MASNCTIVTLFYGVINYYLFYHAITRLHLNSFHLMVFNIFQSGCCDVSIYLHYLRTRKCPRTAARFSVGADRQKVGPDISSVGFNRKKISSNEVSVGLNHECVGANRIIISLNNIFIETDTLISHLCGKWISKSRAKSIDKEKRRIVMIFQNYFRKKWRFCDFGVALLPLLMK